MMMVLSATCDGCPSVCMFLSCSCHYISNMKWHRTNGNAECQAPLLQPCSDASAAHQINTQIEHVQRVDPRKIPLLTLASFHSLVAPFTLASLAPRSRRNGLSPHEGQADCSSLVFSLQKPGKILTFTDNSSMKLQMNTQ